MQGLGVLYGLIHNETHCNDPKGSYKWMSIAQIRRLRPDLERSRPDHFQPMTPTSPHSQGEGDCTGVDGHDGYWYAYCLRRRDNKNIVARAPIENPGPGKWLKWTGHRMECAGRRRNRAPRWTDLSA